MTEPPPERFTRFDEFRSWHRDPTLYRDIYTRAISAVVAALVIYITAAVVGIVAVRPAVLLTAGLVVIYAITLLTPLVTASWPTKGKRARALTRRDLAVPGLLAGLFLLQMLSLYLTRGPE